MVRPPTTRLRRYTDSLLRGCSSPCLCLCPRGLGGRRCLVPRPTLHPQCKVGTGVRPRRTPGDTRPPRRLHQTRTVRGREGGPRKGHSLRRQSSTGTRPWVDTVSKHGEYWVSRSPGRGPVSTLCQMGGVGSGSVPDRNVSEVLRGVVLHSSESYVSVRDSPRLLVCPGAVSEWLGGVGQGLEGLGGPGPTSCLVHL